MSRFADTPIPDLFKIYADAQAEEKRIEALPHRPELVEMRRQLRGRMGDCVTEVEKRFQALATTFAYEQAGAK